MRSAPLLRLPGLRAGTRRAFSTGESGPGGGGAGVHLKAAYWGAGLVVVGGLGFKAAGMAGLHSETLQSVTGSGAADYILPVTVGARYAQNVSW